MPAGKAKPKQKETLGLPPGWEGAEEIGDRYGETVDLTETDGLEGIYMGERELETTSPDGSPRVSKIHDFEVTDPISGSPMTASVWGSFDLDNKLTPELKGKEVRVDYIKTVPIQGGRQTLKIFRVLSR